MLILNFSTISSDDRILKDLSNIFPTTIIPRACQVGFNCSLSLLLNHNVVEGIITFSRTMTLICNFFRPSITSRQKGFKVVSFVCSK